MGFVSSGVGVNKELQTDYSDGPGSGLRFTLRNNASLPDLPADAAAPAVRPDQRCEYM